MELICGNQKILVETVISKYSGILYRVAMMRMKEQADAEEVVQDTFLRLISYVKKGKTFSDEEHLKAWLLRIAINRGKSILTQAWNRRTESMEAAKDIPCEEKAQGYAYDYVLKLPEKYRDILYLHCVEEYTIAEISKILQLSQEVVKKRIQRGRKKILKDIKRGHDLWMKNY
jgi:RNA polymerase sigma-70 factor (ECF subfamily)